ncbi:MAG TPA: hypothetical protein VNI52_02195 [Sphingobacteriaceae bacterium]|nr:hypothetical protein [Sphingobacteriaceae bacterium]
MKKIILMLVLLGSVVTFANAQGKKGNSAERSQKMANALAQKLTLTADQKVQVSAIMLSQAKSQDSIRAAAGEGADMKALRPKVMAVQKANDKKINAILTDDQKKAYATYKKERRNKGKAAPGQ